MNRPLMRNVSGISSGRRTAGFLAGALFCFKQGLSLKGKGR